MQQHKGISRAACFAIALFAGVCVLSAQTPGGIRGTVTDQLGARLAAAQVVATSDAGVVTEGTTGADGIFAINGLAAGHYTVRANVPGLNQPEPAPVDISSGSVRTVNITLLVAASKQEVTVQDDGTATAADTDPNSSAASTVVNGDNLDALSDDPDDLEADLIALAGPTAGGGNGQFYIDGFTAGDAPLPAKSSIREVRVNQNPFSPEYDAIGYGRTEILTKPGTDKFRGQAYLSSGADAINSRNPYANAKAPMSLYEPGGSFGGPISKNASYFVDVSDRKIDNGSIVDAIIAGPAPIFTATPFTAVVPGPANRFRISPRFDYQLGKSHTLTARYALTTTSTDNTGAGGFNLASRSWNQTLTEHAFQATETWLIRPTVVDESHFQFLHQHQTQVSPDTDPSIIVSGAFYAGGPSNSSYYFFHHHYEAQNFVSILSGKHTIKAGARLRAVHVYDYTKANFNGTWLFSSLQQYQQALINNLNGMPGVAAQYSVNTGTPLSDVGQTDIGIFAGDDWRARSNLTFSYGLRWEGQTNIHDRKDFAPRFGLAWAPGANAKSRPKTVIRAGAGIFYDRFNEQNILILERFNGAVQPQYVVLNPATFPALPVLTNTLQTVHTISSAIRAPYVIQSALGLERNLPRNTSLAVTWTNSHALHHLGSRNINAPLAGTYPANPVYPFPGKGPILQYESGGLYNQNQLVTNLNTRVNRKISIFGNYTLNSAHSNTDNLGTFPGNPTLLSSGEYSRASNDIRHRVSIGGNITAPWDLRLSPLITAQSGAPFNITVPGDIYGDTIGVGRPGIYTGSLACSPANGLYATTYGCLDGNPKPGETILSRNAGNGPGLFSVDLRIAKTVYLKRAKERAAPGSATGNAAPAPGTAIVSGASERRGIGGFEGQSTAIGDAGGGRNYNVTFSVSIRNLLNHTNPGPTTGNISSPLFGQSNQIAGGFGAFSGNASNRRLELQARFAF